MARPKGSQVPRSLVEGEETEDVGEDFGGEDFGAGTRHRAGGGLEKARGGRCNFARS